MNTDRALMICGQTSLESESFYCSFVRADIGHMTLSSFSFLLYSFCRKFVNKSWSFELKVMWIICLISEQEQSGRKDVIGMSTQAKRISNGAPLAPKRPRKRLLSIAVILMLVLILRADPYDPRRKKKRLVFLQMPLFRENDGCAGYSTWVIRSEKSSLRAIYWSHSVCEREAVQVESESLHVFHTLIPFSAQRRIMCSLFSSLSGNE